MSVRPLKYFYRRVVKSIMTYRVTVWHGNCSIADKATLQRIIKTLEKILGLLLPAFVDIYTHCCHSLQHNRGQRSPLSWLFCTATIQKTLQHLNALHSLERDIAQQPTINWNSTPCSLSLDSHFESLKWEGIVLQQQHAWVNLIWFVYL